MASDASSDEKLTEERKSSSTFASWGEVAACRAVSTGCSLAFFVPPGWKRTSSQDLVPRGSSLQGLGTPGFILLNLCRGTWEPQNPSLFVLFRQILSTVFFVTWEILWSFSKNYFWNMSESH